ncbi:hypothetical protein [Sphingomonas sp. SCN 67-18]|uniref:hypothetical protein n=1 Tax=uncultured Sphingomonas sp. TaxID=158754 RepID=UPI0025F8453B|nr:hypothetical protein [Sphingomonas sp. SCN 67-18]
MLLSSTCLAQSAFAQVVDVPPPTRYQVDENDVDVARGLYTGSRRDMVIGQGLGSLFFDVKYGQAPGTSLPGLVSSVGGGAIWTAITGFTSHSFSLSGSTFTSLDGSGATLVKSGSTYTLTESDGTKYFYGYTVSQSGEPAGTARASAVTYADGRKVNFNWVSTVYCSNNRDGCAGGTYGTAVRLQSYSNSNGYMIHFDYSADDADFSALLKYWRQITKITAINLGVDYCSPTAFACTGLTQSWPATTYSGNNVTDALMCVIELVMRRARQCRMGSGMM